MSISRRRFIETAVAAGTVLHAEDGPMPTRVLGRTGQRVSILGLGCGSRLLMYKEEEKAQQALNRALDLGITYVDTAYSYGDGVSETWVGGVMKRRRKGVFLVTKVQVRNGEEAMRIVEGSLKRLQTDHLDLIHVHGLMDADDLEAVEAKDGVLARLYKLRDQKVTRFIGVTCHNDPHVLKTALEHNDFDCTQMALNAARVGPTKSYSDPYHECFETIALPVAQSKNMGITAMKVFGQEKLSGAAPAEHAGALCDVAAGCRGHSWYAETRFHRGERSRGQELHADARGRDAEPIARFGGEAQSGDGHILPRARGLLRALLIAVVTAD